MTKAQINKVQSLQKSYNEITNKELIVEMVIDMNDVVYKVYIREEGSLLPDVKEFSYQEVEDLIIYVKSLIYDTVI